MNEEIFSYRKLVWFLSYGCYLDLLEKVEVIKEFLGGEKYDY